MDLDLYKSELCLTDNAPIRLLSARGVRITCTAGLVWLTVEGEAGDIFLAPGQSHLVRGRGLGLLEAIGSGRVRFDKTGRAHVGSPAGRGAAAMAWLASVLASRRTRRLKIGQPAFIIRACSHQLRPRPE
jgi:hypothetical protein